MNGDLLELARETVTSPWIYVLILALAAIDAFFPAVPSESVVITAGVFAASGEPDLPLVIAAAAAGALAGDHVSYLIGRTGGGRLLARGRMGRPDGRRAAALARARRALAERGGVILVVARYIPGGRTATTLTMGAVGYPPRSFTFFDVIAALSWGLYSGLVGYLGGAAFENDPLRGVLLGLGIAVGVTVLVETIRALRRRSRRPPPPPPHPTAEPTDPKKLAR